MQSAVELEGELKDFIIKTLVLEDVQAGDIPSDMPLFGEGLGLDSIDALELGVALQKHYKIKIDPNDKRIREHFASVRSLAAFVAAQQNGSGPNFGQA